MNKESKSLKSSYIRRRVVIILFVSLTLAASINALGICLSDNTVLNEYYGMIITVASIFAGFSFTNLGTLLGICGTELANKFSGSIHNLF